MQVSLSLIVLLHKASKKVYYLDQRSSGYETKLVLRHQGLSLQPSLNHPLLKLHGVVKKLDTPIVVAHLRITFVFADMDDVTQSLLFGHFRACEDLAEE
ncbi:hypothetical protein Tco_1177719, partial [Tanacetum coccineum]